MKVAKLVITILVICVALQLPLNALTQNQTTVNLKTRIHLGANPIRFDSLVSIISRQAKVQFSFNTGKITPDRMFTLKPGEQSLEDVLIQVKSKTGIYYKTIGSHIVLLDKSPEIVLNKPGNTTSTYRPVSKKPSIKKPVEKITEKKTISYPAGGTKQHPSDDSTITANENEDLSESTKKADDYLYAAENREAITDSSKTRLADTARRILAKNHPSSISTEKENSKIKQQTLTEGKSFRFFAGGGLVRTAGIRDDINANLMGWEANVKTEKRITQNFSATVSFGVAHFSGRYKSKFNRFRSTGDSTIQNFTLTPLLTGIRYKLGTIMYLSAEAGITFKNKANDRTRTILSPSAGILVPIKGDSKIDIGIRFSHLMVSPSLLGDPVLQTGGYSYLSLRLAYGF